MNYYYLAQMLGGCVVVIVAVASCVIGVSRAPTPEVRANRWAEVILISLMVATLLSAIVFGFEMMFGSAIAATDAQLASRTSTPNVKLLLIWSIWSLAFSIVVPGLIQIDKISKLLKGSP